MAEYRDRKTGQLKTQGQIRRENSNVSLPRTWTASTLEALGVDPVKETFQPEITDLQQARRSGVEKNSDGEWQHKWSIIDRHFEYTDDDGNVVTKKSQDDAYLQKLQDNLAENHKTTRNQKLAETDFYALSDVTMSDAMKTYRQALRDLPDHSNWPNLEEGDWPTKP